MVGLQSNIKEATGKYVLQVVQFILLLVVLATLELLPNLNQMSKGLLEMNVIRSRDEFRFCYKALRALWSARTPDDIYTAKRELKKVINLHRALNVPS
jgi:hypothetical protein